MLPVSSYGRHHGQADPGARQIGFTAMAGFGSEQRCGCPFLEPTVGIRNTDPRPSVWQIVADRLTVGYQQS